MIVDNAVDAALLIGLGGSQSLLSWSGGDGADLISRGDGPEEPYVAYLFNGHESEFSGTGAIPMEQAREAVRAFFATGERPSAVVWQEG